MEGETRPALEVLVCYQTCSSMKSDDHTRKLVRLLGQSIGSKDEADTLSSLGIDLSSVTTKTFGQVTYRSASDAGLSLQFEHGQCQAIDLYNEGAVKGWQPFTHLPLSLHFSNTDTQVAQHSLTLDKNTCGKILVRSFGEPDRKGGGEPLKGGGASGMGPSVWMEWQHARLAGRHVYLMVELMGADARGAQRWEKGAEAFWGICTFSLPPPSST